MGQDRITPEERAAIERATAEGRVTRVEVRVPMHLRQRKAPKTTDRQPASKAPAPRTVPTEMSVRAALEWAFGVECAYFDRDELLATSGAGRPSIGMEAIIEQRFMLGKVAIDTTPGRSEPAEDADLIASVVRATLRFDDAVWVADLARAGITPDPMIGACPKMQPTEWHCNRYGWHGKTEDAKVLGHAGWSPQQRRNRKGAIVYDVVRYTPCTWSPSLRQIAHAQRRYLEWWGLLLDLQVAIRDAGPRWFTITQEMPPMTPWKVAP